MKATTRNVVRLGFVVGCAAVGFGPSAFAQREIGESPVAYKWRMLQAQRQNADAAYEATVKAKTELNAEIKAARAKFWETYPNGPGADAAREHFAEVLHQKDMYYMILNQYPQDPSSRERSATVVADLLDSAGGGFKVDNGIWPSAKPEFEAWADAFQKNLADRGGVFSRSVMNNVLDAAAASDKEYQVYVTQRDWAEFEAANRIPLGLDTTDKYGIALYIRRGKLSYDGAVTTYDGMTQVLGKDLVESTAARMLAYFKEHAKAPTGDMVVTVPPPLKKTPDGTLVDDYSAPLPTEVFGTYRDPLVAFEILATQDDDYRYLLWLLKGHARYIPGASRWLTGKSMADVLIRAFGRSDVMAASHQVRLATKRLISGSIINQGVIGATRNIPWEALEDILARKNPQGYVRAMVAYHENPKAPESVDLDAAYAKFVSANDETQVLAAARKMALAKPNVDNPREIDSLLENVRNPQVAEKPAEVLADFPKYLAWRKFPAGTKVTYVWRGLNSIRPGGEELMASRPGLRSTYTMDAINDEQAHLWLGEIAYDSPNGTAHPPHETEMAYPAKVPQRALVRPPTRHYPGASPTSESTASGDETLEIGGRAIATHWEEVTKVSDNKKEVTKTWTSDEVPSGLVRKTEMTVTGNRVYGRETLVESVRGTGHDFTAQHDPTIDGPPVLQLTGLLPPAAITAPPAAPVAHVPSAPSPNSRAGPPATTPPAVHATAPAGQSAHSEVLVRYSRLMIRYNRAQREMAQRRNPRHTAGEAIPQDVLDAWGRCDSEMKEVYAAVRTNQDDAITKSLDALEPSLADVEKYLGF